VTRVREVCTVHLPSHFRTVIRLMPSVRAISVSGVPLAWAVIAAFWASVIVCCKWARAARRSWAAAARSTAIRHVFRVVAVVLGVDHVFAHRCDSFACLTFIVSENIDLTFASIDYPDGLCACACHV